MCTWERETKKDGLTVLWGVGGCSFVGTSYVGVDVVQGPVLL